MKSNFLKIWRSGIAMLLALCLVAGILPTAAFAAEKPIQYVSLGDSMTNGLGLGGGYDSTGHNGYLEVDKYSYPALLAKHYGWELTQLATSAMRAEDLHYILEVGTENAYPGDEWTQDDLLDGRWNGIGQEGSNWYGMTAEKVFQKAIAEADVISMAVGNANFGVYMMDMITAAVGMPDTYGKDYSHCTLDNALVTLELDAEKTELVKGIFATVLEYLSSYIPAELAKTLADRFAYVVANYVVHFAGALDRIVELNPDVEIIIVSLMNTLSGYDMYITYEGTERYLDMATVLDMILVPLNAYQAGLAASKQDQAAYANAKFYFAEAGDLETLSATYSQEYAANEAFYLSRFVPNITDFIFPMIGIPADVITAEDVFNYRHGVTLEAYTNDQVFAINVYNVVEDAILNAMEQTPVINLDELTALKLPDGAEPSAESFLVALLGTELFNADGSLNSTTLYENGTIVALLSLYGRLKLADGVSAHPSKNDHIQMTGNIISAYDGNYTAKDETEKNIEEALKLLVNVLKAYGPDVWKEIRTDYEAAGIDLVIGDDFKYVALGDGTATADGYAEKVYAYLKEQAAEDEKTVEFANAAKVGNSVSAEAAALSKEVVGANLITLGFSLTDMLANALVAEEKPDWAALLGEEAAAYVEDALAQVTEKIAALELGNAEIEAMLNTTVEAYAYNAVSYAMELPVLVEAIREVNEEAVIIIVGMYNPFKNASVKAMGIELDLSVFGSYIDYLVEAVCVYGISMAKLTGDIDYVDAREVEILETELGLSEVLGLMEGDVSALYPSEEGRIYIAGQIKNALKITFPGDEPVDTPVDDPADDPTDPPADEPEDEPTEDPVYVLWGDADGDNFVTPIDAMLVLQFYVGDIPETVLNTAATDVDGDGFATPIDAMLILQYYVGDIAKFPVEG